MPKSTFKMRNWPYQAKVRQCGIAEMRFRRVFSAKAAKRAARIIIKP